MIKRLSKFLLVLGLITSWIFSGWPGIQTAEAVTTDTFTTTTTWTAPTGVTSVTAEVWGGGGGGGGQNLASDGGGGGGGGAYSRSVITVVPATIYTVTVGAAGTGNAGCTASTAGGDSWFSTTGTILAKGGSPGACSTGTPPAGGLGGVAASGVGTIKFSGGQGEIGRNNAAGLGGYGGSSAGTAANGFSGPQTWSTATYPTASTPAGGGHGGNGGATANAAGSAPASGNGGGGGGAAEGTNISGGNGAVGKVILTYNKPPNAPSQNSPANAATGVSVTPTFLMTATDADTTADNLG
ncbi:MAG: glycine-rich domain-containing protein, partial [Candidatus Sungiibacteriota bacterium]